MKTPRTIPPPQGLPNGVRRLLTASAGLLCLWAINAPVTATAQEASAISEEQLKVDYKQLLEKEVSILETMDQLDDDLHRRSLDLEALQEKRQRISVHLMELEVLFEEATAALQNTRKLIRKRLGAIVRTRRSSMANMLLSAEGTIANSRRERVIRLLLESDKKRIDAYRKRLMSFEIERMLLSNKRADLDKLETEVAKTRNRLAQHRKDRAQILQLVDDERTFFEKAHTDIAKAHSTITDRIKRLEQWHDKRLDFRALKGQFRLPMSYATIVSGFGKRRNPKLKTTTLQHGIEIKSRGADSVRSIYWGRVAFAGKLTGYGMTIILDHTLGHHTLYARLNQVLVKEGDVVEPRQVLGTVGGHSALGTPDSLYFELRVDGQAIDPKGWFL